VSNAGATPPPAEGTLALPAPASKTGLSIRSVLLIMLLVVSIGSNVVVGLIGYFNGQKSLTEAAYNNLIEVRDSRARELVSLFDSITDTLALVSQGQSAKEAVQAFTAGFDELRSADLSEEDRAAIEQYFLVDFAGRLEDARGESVDTTPFIPTNPAESYLKLNYVVPYDNFEAAIANDDAGDGSAWSAAHAQYHNYFRTMANLFQFEDVLLIDTSGDVVYSAFKGADLGANLESGALHVSNLAEAYRQAISGNVADNVVVTDFEDYAPSLGTPAGWAATPIVVDGSIVGVLAIELPVMAINDVMTGNQNWAASGLGQTGETYIVGANDNLMRSPSRDLIEDPAGYEAQAIRSGMTPAEAAEAVANGTLLLQPVFTDAVDKASAGEAGTAIGQGYLGNDTIVAYAPLDINGLDWVIVAEIDSAEALAPVTDFTRNLFLSSVAIVIVVSIISVIIAGFIVRPLRRLRDAARRIAAGESGVQVDAGTSDELADVGVAFNDMSRSLAVKAALLEEQQAENERLLLSMMPETLVRKYKEGATTIAFDHQEVSVIFADIVGFESYSKGLDSEAALAQLNEILLAFDDAAERFGIERVRTTRSGYLASCGMSIPRVDNARRTVEFAIELQRVLERFGGQHGVRLTLRAGIDTGTVTSGLVGQNHIAFDLWGDAVNLAFQVQAGSHESGIFLTQAVVDRVRDLVPLQDWGVVNTQNGPQHIYRVDPQAASAQV
jgi:class 3 adenylate cyclase